MKRSRIGEFGSGNVEFGNKEKNDRSTRSLDSEVFGG